MLQGINNKKANQNKVISPFSGAGGLDIGFERAGFKIAVCVEVDHACCETLYTNKPELAIINKSIVDVTGQEVLDAAGLKVGEAALVIGGPPCQSFSLAGLRRGLDDERGRLLFEYVRIVRETLPKAFVLENVKGLTAKKFQGLFDLLKTWLRDNGYGELAYAVLNTKDYGIPQNRERLWMFARLGGLPDGFSIVPPKRPNKLRLKDFLDKNPDPSLYLSSAQIKRLKDFYGFPSFKVKEPSCLDLYNRKVRDDGICITILAPEHNKLRVVEVPKRGKEIVRKLSVPEQFRLMGFKDGEIDFAGQSYSQLSKRAANGWDVNVVGILLKHIFSQAI